MFFDSKKYILSILLATILSGFSLTSILVYSDPKNSGLAIFFLLYTSIFLFFTGLFSLLGVILRKFLLRGMFASNLSNSIRQAIFLSIFLLGSLLLASHGLLFWWVSLSLFLPFVALEIFLNLKI